MTGEQEQRISGQERDGADVEEFCDDDLVRKLRCCMDSAVKDTPPDLRIRILRSLRRAALSERNSRAAVLRWADCQHFKPPKSSDTA